MDLAEIAKQECGVPTLETRNRDTLDFHWIGVAGLRKALQRAYQLGWDERGEPDDRLPVIEVAESIRTVTAKMQKAIDGGQRSTAIDAHDLIDALLTVADELDPAL